MAARGSLSGRFLNYAVFFGGIAIGSASLVYLLALRILGVREGFYEIASIGIGLVGFWTWYLGLLHYSSLVPTIISIAGPAVVLSTSIMRIPNKALIDLDKSEIILAIILSAWISISVLLLTALGRV